MAEHSSEKNKDYGLPKVDPQPIDRKQPGIAKAVPVIEPTVKKNDNRLIIIVLSIIAALILASVFYMIFWNDDAEDAVSPVTTIDDRSGIDPEDGSSDEMTEGEAPSETTEAEEMSEEPGSIITISERTNRYYIFLGSYKFRAYAQRHAEKLAADGFAVKLVTPDNWVGIRVAVGNYAKEEDAKNDAQQIKSQYGHEVVISKY